MGSINMKDILEKALEEQNYLMHHGILGQKWGVRRYQNKDGSLTEEGRVRYLKEGTEERKKLDNAAARKFDAEIKLDNAVERQMNKQQKQRFKELRNDKNLSDVDDDDLWDYFVEDELFDDNKTREKILNANKKLASEVNKADSEYATALRQMYDSVRDKTLDKIKVNKKEKDAYKRFVQLYEKERIIDSYKQSYGDNWKKMYDKYHKVT